MKNRPFIFIIVLMFLASMNFMSKFFYFAFATVLILLLCKTNFKFNYTSLLYLVTGFIMATYHISNGVLAAVKCFGAVICYWIGYNIASGTTQDEVVLEDIIDSKKNGLEFSYAMLVVIASGSFIHYILNFIINLGSDMGRNTVDFWTGEVMSATCQASLSCIMSGYAISKILSPRKKNSRIVGIFIVLGILAYNLVLAGRTLISMLCIVFAVGIIFVISKEKNASKKTRTLMFIGLAFILISLIVLANIGGIWDYIEGSNLYNRFFATNASNLGETSRWDAKLYYLEHMFEHPFGGLHLREEFGTYAHGLILDAYDEFGFVAAVLLIAIVAIGVKELLEFISKKEIPIAYRCSFLCAYVAILIEFCVEPILAGMILLFTCYSLINGMIAKLNREYS